LTLIVVLGASGSALVEFDLGSASRHKLVYLSALLPLALMPKRKSEPTP
jgi:hypothetical protein